MSNIQHDQADAPVQLNSHVTKSEVNLGESGDLQEKEEYRISHHAPEPVNESEDVNQEEEDLILNHDVLRGNGV